MKPIALDAMGGDRGPGEIVAGAVEAARLGVPVVLVGDKSLLAAELDRRQADLSVVHATEVIDMHDAATEVRKKRGATVNVAVGMVSSGEASAIVSMGHSGATMASSIFGLGRISGVERPAILVELPSERGHTFLLDVGANADCRPGFLAQFARMGQVYARTMGGLDNPAVGLLSIGEEETKGSELVIVARSLIAGLPLNFVGYIEGNDIFDGPADVVVTDGFTGNVVLKLAEGEARTLFRWVKRALTGSPLARMGALLARSGLLRVADRLDPAEYGAMPLLGVCGLVFIGHGHSGARAVRSALLRAAKAVEAGLVGQIERGLEQAGA